MSFLFEHTWIWVVFTAIVFFIGYSMFINDKKNRTLLATVIATMVVLIGGVALERTIETDREALRRTLKEISAAIKSDDFQQVNAYIAPDATQLRGLATAGMERARLSQVYFHNIEIRVNDLTVPTTAELRFVVAFRGRGKGSSFFVSTDFEFYDQYRFTATFEKHDNRWLATDDILFDDRFPLNFTNTTSIP